MDHQVCLRWNNFHSSLASTLEILWDEESFCDVTLFCEGEEIRAHKVVLSACSLTFKSLLRNNVCQHPIVILHDIRLNILEAILQFIYKGEVNIEQDQLNGLLRAATSLQIKGLAGVRNEEEKEVQTDSQKKTKKTYCENSNVRSHNLIPKRKKPKVSLPLTENIETTLVSPKEELCSEEEAYNIVSYNNDDEQESDDLVRHERATDGSDCNNHEDPLVTNANTNVPQDYTNPAEFLPNSSQAFTCNNAQFPPYPCPFCRRAYASWGFRRRHIKAIHAGSPKLTCKWCNVVLASQEDWENHVINEHNLSRSDAEQGLKVLEEAHMVLQTSNVLVDVVKEGAGRSLTKK